MITSRTVSYSATTSTPKSTTGYNKTTARTISNRLNLIHRILTIRAALITCLSLL